MKSSARRSPCPVACALDLFGDRWTLLVIRDLFLGKQRYDEFLASPEGIATNILSDRLKSLTTHGLLKRAADPDDGRRVIYQLTERGRSTKDFLLPLARWGLAQCRGTRAMPGSTLEPRGPGQS
ncbi:helix-turn-helix domain-containing protein [Haloferula sp. BvORR071]|uniref:winged helix-turn-helix transcriptional regulator n=1 Tax=Haloferula sp. BvORR071 TaxID=1396141 RepID=UPI000550A3D6|nr:helix-turn-helix domain-containing protein [Haloferula sp. BvORR071]